MISGWGAGRAKAENRQQGKSGVISPVHLDVVGQLHGAVLSLVSQVDAVQVLVEREQRSAPSDTPNEEMRNKNPKHRRLDLIFNWK